MIRSFPMLSLGLICGAFGLAAAHTVGGGESVKPLDTHEIVEVINGMDSSATFVEVTLAPGQSGSAHRHPGPVISEDRRHWMYPMLGRSEKWRARVRPDNWSKFA